MLQNTFLIVCRKKATIFITFPLQNDLNRAVDVSMCHTTSLNYLLIHQFDFGLISHNII